MTWKRGLWIATAIVGLAILILSLIPKPPPIVPRIRWGDKLAHCMAYFAFSFLLMLSLRRTREPAAILAVIGACFLYGLMIEVLQPLTRRHTEVLDLLANLVGAASGTLIAARLARRRFPKTP